MTNQWKNIHLDFNYQGREWETSYQQAWEKNDFNYLQTKEWIDIGMKPQDVLFCAYLRDIKKLDSLQVLNFGNLKQLRQEYQNKETNHLKDLESALEEARKEIDQLNLTLLQQQKISSQVSKSKQELINDYNLLEKENQELLKNLKERPQEVLVWKNNNLNNLERDNKELLKITHLLNQKQPLSSSLTNWISKNKESLLMIGGITLISYLLLQE